MEEKQSQLGETLKQQGMERSITSADNKIEDWSVSAFNFLMAFLAESEGEFMAEDVREYAKSRGLEDPPSKRAWGSIIIKAKKQGLIGFVRLSQVSNPKAHRANASVWTSTEYLEIKKTDTFDHSSFKNSRFQAEKTATI